MATLSKSRQKALVSLGLNPFAEKKVKAVEKFAADKQQVINSEEYFLFIVEHKAEVLEAIGEVSAVVDTIENEQVQSGFSTRLCKDGITRVKTERVVYFPNNADKSQRKFLSIEKPFVDALNVITGTPEELNEWLVNTIAVEPNHAASIVRNTIVSTLFRLAKNNHKNFVVD
jgi:hypothetical protein